ncbi:PREDICTED: uncharacterized protein LOC108367482 [Rhagoletis zephyria]|uniref:uncharacterized protein LOC108367482 n=1 Tax=Rhagoletis zephyria TaxID=28612 RepID=UPI000811733A|nr:PREDICTED: uncharacterized protein LOC108367482 [Rhagoletis zephyria]
MYSRVMCLASIALFAILANAVVNAGVARDSNNLTQQEVRDITVVKDIAEFKKNHPGLVLARMTKEESNARSQSVRYSLGGRVSGDRLVAQAADVFTYQVAKDVTIQLTYPQSGAGSIVTYVEIVCNQDNNEGNAYVVAGGIGQRFISIVLEATQTEGFSYNAQYYGSG